ncbi:MAG TPA: manganese catalase family protein [Edaphocola sp.]|nr:manganese catalase family protein [Edaphocola sp.]
MFYHSKELQFNARVSRADPRFARILLEQFGGPNGELKAAMQYFTQAFSCRHPYPDKYDMLMDIATEEFSHLEIVGATIQMLLGNTASQLKETAEAAEISTLLEGTAAKEQYMHEAMFNPQFCNESGGGPTVSDSNGNPWTAAYINANGDLTVDLRSNMAAEGRAKIVYEYLLKFTDDRYVKDTLRFLMTREVAHFQMFEAALDTIQPNFPPGVRQSDPRYSNKYFNMSKGEKSEGPWNKGTSTKLNEEWEYINDPGTYVNKSDGLTQLGDYNTAADQDGLDELERSLSEIRSAEMSVTSPEEYDQWCRYGNRDAP